MATWFNRHFEGLEHVPGEGPVLVACNHISNLDPLAQGLFLVRAGRRPRFLAKAELWNSWFLRRLLDGTSMIKVHRGTGSRGPVEAAEQALRDGECVLVYPEATLTDTPDFMPMQGKTGVARIALDTSVPVLPLAVWGTQHVFPRKGEKNRLAFGRPLMVKAGPPLDLSRYEEGQDDPKTLRAATDEVMGELSALVADMRSRYPKRWADR